MADDQMDPLRNDLDVRNVPVGEAVRAFANAFAALLRVWIGSSLGQTLTVDDRQTAEDAIDILFALLEDVNDAVPKVQPVSKAPIAVRPATAGDVSRALHDDQLRMRSTSDSSDDASGPVVGGPIQFKSRK
jgi:hypothetical protein